MLAQVVAHAVVSERVKAGAQSAGARRASDDVFKDEIPANQEGDELAHADVTVHVGGATGLRHPHPELSVADSCERPDNITLYTSYMP